MAERRLANVESSKSKLPACFTCASARSVDALAVCSSRSADSLSFSRLAKAWLSRIF